ncbi:hypothetical protein PC116_g15798 [Phytophthora cactorum]|uniref:Uncharacterized protein n=1 Tax=Phytophthora cactorum TaxID=29920 RepID=A0A8T0YGC8_9STRA|nr:hypothetical protein PC111_g16407 [Phytophthora cactorum]KAG2820115.1 hypothetical protein PC112_g11909 [Phytophthora cactorum]KAG2833945.1 hypothetical protein PC113_g20486 [Phytophthora cactorum]KAG2879254.1 hypothetical protein PC114_g22664 [Phytophthora cactorum]KAG2887910.1 hypothetical protein PC115_g20201 [Phytophthora cactorum]
MSALHKFETLGYTVMYHASTEEICEKWRNMARKSNHDLIWFSDMFDNVMQYISGEQEIFPTKRPAIFQPTSNRCRKQGPAVLQDNASISGFGRNAQSAMRSEWEAIRLNKGDILMFRGRRSLLLRLALRVRANLCALRSQAP